MRNYIKCQPFFNVVADGVATLNLELGMTINKLLLVLGGTAFTKAMITGIKVKMNGKTVWESTGSRLDLRNKYCKIADAAGYLTIPFTELFALNRGDRSLGAWATATGVNAVTVEVTIAGATAPTLAAYAEVDAPQNLGPICAMSYHPVTIGAAGKFNVAIPYGDKSGGLLKRLLIYHANATALEIKRDGLVIFEGVKADFEHMQKEYDRVPQAGLIVYEPIVSGDLADMVNLANAQSFVCNVTVSGADTLHVYAETINHLQRI